MPIPPRPPVDLFDGGCVFIDGAYAPLSEGKISDGDLDLMLITDDPAEAAQAIITAYKSLGKTAGNQYDEHVESRHDGE